MHSASTRALVLLALVALVATTPLADAAKPEKPTTDTPKKHDAPPPAPTPSPPPASAPGPTTPTPAPTLAPASAPARAPPHFASALPTPPAPAPIVATAALPDPRAPTAPTTQRAERLDVAGAGWPDAEPAYALALAPAALASAATAAPSAPGPLAWALPLLGLFGVGAALLARPRGAHPGARADAAAALAYTTSAPDVPSMLRAGKACVERGALADAVAWFTHALDLDPKLSVAHFAKGVCLAGLGRHEDAHAALAHAYALDPTEGAVRLEYARAASRTRRASAAMDALGPLLAALPELATDVQADEAFAGLRDHPRFLAMVGAL